MHATSHDGGTIRAASLVRVSTKGQADKGLSLDEQDRRVAKYLSDQEWTPAGEYREPGVSGNRKDRPKLDRLLADAEVRPLRPLRRRDGASHERPEAQRRGVPVKGEVYTGQHEAIVSEDVWSKGAGAAVRRRAAAGDVEERTLRLGLALVFALLMGPWMAHHLARDGR